MGWLKRFRQKYNSEEHQEKVRASVYYALFFFCLTAFCFMLFGTLTLNTNFMTERHNIDLTVNALNLKCGGCLANFTDTGINSKGQIETINLQKSYIGSMYRSKLQFLAVIVTSFFSGLLLCGLIDSLDGLKNEEAKIKQRKDKKEEWLRNAGIG